MRSRALITVRLTTTAPQNVGSVPQGRRLTFPISGGVFEGERLRGRVLAGGDDWTLERSDGVLELDARLTLETDEGALVHATFNGMRDDSAVGGAYFRTIWRFETAAPDLVFLNRLLAVGSGDIRADGPVQVVEEVL